MKLLRKTVVLIVAAMLLLNITAFADNPYQFYEYSTDNYNGLIWSTNYVGNAKAAPASFIFSEVYTSQSLKLEKPISQPEDIRADNYGNIHLLDSGNGRIVVIDSSTARVKLIIKLGEHKGVAVDFKGARGLFIADEKAYVCMTPAAKICSFTLPDFILDPDKELSHENTGYIVDKDQEGMPPEIIVKIDKIYSAPDFKGLIKNVDFKPIKMAVDKSGRMYVVCENIFHGLITIETDGSFTGFVGSNRVAPSLLDLFWRSISTKAQIDAQLDFIPVEFNSVAIDKDGFLYTTARGDKQNIMVRKFNLLGNDVLTRGVLPINGDISALVRQGSPGTLSSFIDVRIGPAGVFSCLDSERGRVFTYSSDGNLLFVFGGLQVQKGSFKRPVAIEWGDGKIYVLDKDYGEINVFIPTDYGKKIMRATELSYQGKFDQSWEVWKEVLKLNPSNQTANINVGKALYKQQQYKVAMEHFRLGNDIKLYSNAFEKYRKERTAAVIPWVIAAICLIVGIVFVISIIRYLINLKNRILQSINDAKKHVSRMKIASKR